MNADRVMVSQETSYRLMRFQLPYSMDTMEIDDVMQTVLADLDKSPQDKWMVDLSAVEYMGSSMLGLMVNIRQRVRQGGGKLVLFGLSPQLLQTFQACCLERLFTLAKTRDDAATALARA